MNSPENALLYINSFFATYAQALENYDTKGLAWHYMMPSTFLANEYQTVFTEPTPLEGFFNQGIAFYKQYGIVHARPTVWSKRPWTDKIAKAKVKWEYFDEKNNALYSCDYQYVLKLDKNNDWKIILSVAINEKERMEEWLASGKA